MSDAEDKKSSNLDAFLKKSGYEKADVLDQNDRTRTYVTENGGKYHLLKNGTIQIIKGPNYPNFEPEA